MARSSESDAATRRPLSRERVLSAALALADTEGIESLTMRRLGQELGVEAMSLYNHVANKDDLLNGLVEAVNSEIELPPSGADWKTAIRKSAISAHETLLRHPWLHGQMMAQSAVAPARMRWMEAMLACLREAGFSAESTCHAYHALDSHISGFMLWESSFPAMEELIGRAASFFREFPVEEFPYVTEHIEQHMKVPGDEDESVFEFGLDLILDGLERMRDNVS